MSATSETRVCKGCRAEFVIEPDDFSFYAKIGVPPPKLCSVCRRKRRLSFRNDRDFYRRACDFCKRPIVALYPAESKFPVYCQTCWWSDAWDPFSYGRKYDSARPFFDQCDELFRAVPRISMQNDDGAGSVNCEYTTDWWFSKNCYMAMCGWQNENNLYSYHSEFCKDIVDSSMVNHCNWVYECLGSTNCSRTSYSAHCHDCHDCMLSLDLRGCSDCVMCVGLRNRRYCILNQQYSKEEYLVKRRELNLGSRSAIEHRKTEFDKFTLGFPRRYAQILKSIATTGDILVNCKNSRECFFGNGLENCRFYVVSDGGKESYDCYATGHPELCYESITTDHSYGSVGNIFSVECRDVRYSFNCRGSQDLLGCAAVRKGQYAILNTRYSKEEYEALQRRIVEDMQARGEWGEFFPAAISPFTYNESIAYDYDPLEEMEARAGGFRWKPPAGRDYKATLAAADIPDAISGTGDEIVNQVIGCAHADGLGRATCNEKCTTAFRITRDELGFYRTMGVPSPVLCPNCRHYQRTAKRNPPRLWRRKCVCSGAALANHTYKNTTAHFHGTGECPNEFETSYAPERPEIVYCENCYQAEVA